MSLLLIVLLLDLSHLELVEDVLKETNFNNKDWEQLGRELGVHVESLKFIYSENSLKLKGCLREWLRPGTSSYYWRIPDDDDPSPTLFGLADALDGIGYSKAAEYIIITCKLIIISVSCIIQFNKI